MPPNKDKDEGKNGEKKGEQEGLDKKDGTNRTKEINGQIAADLEFTRRAQELLSTLKSKQKTAEEPERPTEKTRDVTDKHK